MQRPLNPEYTCLMGLLSRLFVPRNVRRAAHPVRTVKRAVTPRPVRQTQHALHPIQNASYQIEQALRAKHRQ